MYQSGGEKRQAFLEFYISGISDSYMYCKFLSGFGPGIFFPPLEILSWYSVWGLFECGFNSMFLRQKGIKRFCVGGMRNAHG